MVQTKQVFGPSEKQVALMQRLQEEGWLRTDLKFESLSPAETSNIIASAIEVRKNRRSRIDEEVTKLADDEHVIPSEPAKKVQLNYMRFGMCVKLAYPKHNISSGPGLIGFRKEVRKLYDAVSNLEQEMSAN